MRYDMLIVGAGISGLSLAHYATRQGWRVLVLERETRVGGILHSARFREGNGFWLELGAHSCFNSYGNIINILEQQNLLGHIQPRAKVGFKVWKQGRLKSIPSQMGFGELLWSAPRLLFTRKAGLSVADYFSRIVGPKNFDRLFASAFSAVICQPADQFPADMLFRKKARRKDIQKSFTFDEGIQTLADGIARDKNIEIRADHEVESVIREEGGFGLRLTGGDTLSAPRLGIAAPVDQAAGLLREAMPELAALLGEVKTATVESLGVVVPASALNLKPLGGIIGLDTDFYSVVSRDTVPDPKYRGFTFHFKPGVLDSRRDQERLIGEVLGVRPQHMVARAERISRLPALRVGHDRRVEQINRLLAAHPLALTGNYFLGVSMEDCVTRSRSECERLALNS